MKCPIVLIFFLPSCLSHVTQRLYSVEKCHAYRTITLIMSIISTFLEVRLHCDWQAMASKLSLRHIALSFRHFFGFLHNTYVVMAQTWKATPRLLNTCITSCSKFARNYSMLTMRRPVYKDSCDKFFNWMCEGIESCDYQCNHCKARVHYTRTKYWTKGKCLHAIEGRPSASVQ